MMPIFTIETPSGRRIKIEADDEATAIRGAQEFEAGQASPVSAESAALSELSAITQGFSPDPNEVRAQMRADQIEKFRGPSGASDLFGNSFTLGLQDKVAGLAGGVQGMISGQGFSQGYDIGRRSQEILEERARQRSGGLGTAAELAGAVGTGVLAKAPAAATALGRVFQTGKEAALLGAGQGFGDSTADSLSGMAGDALMGGAMGGALGGTLGAGMEIGRGVFNAGRAAARGLGGLLDDPAGRAARKVTKALADDSVTPAQAAARMAKRDTALINTADENLLGLGRAAAAKPGAGRKTLNKALDAQQKASQGKVLAAVNETLGGNSSVPFNRRVANMITQRSSNGQKLYDAAFKRNFGKAFPAKLNALQDRIPGEAVRNAMKIAQTEGRPFGQQLIASIDDMGNVAFSRAPSLREWHYIQRGLRSAADSAYRNGVGEVGTAYKNLHRQILDAMDEVSPIYKQARKAYASQSDMIDAIRRGREILLPSNAKNVDALADDIARMSKAEKEMLQIGLARQMQDMLEATPDAAGDMVKKIFGNAAKRNAIRAAFDNDSAFRAFQTKMTNLGKEAKSFQYIRTGSRTSFVDAEKQGAGVLGEAAAAVVDTASTGGMNTTIRGAVKLLSGMDEGVAAEVAKILVERDPNAVLRALTPAQNRLNNQAARDALLAKAAPIARALTVGGSGYAGSQIAVGR
jgi:hypothetical protein